MEKLVNQWRNIVSKMSVSALQKGKKKKKERGGGGGVVVFQILTLIKTT